MSITILKPIGDYLMDTTNPNDKMVKALVEDVRSMKTNPVNSTVVPVKFLNFQVYDDTQTKPQNNLLNDNNFFYATYYTSFNYIPKPINFKTGLISDIDLSVCVFADAKSVGGYIPPVITNFNIDFYLSLSIANVINGNIYLSKSNGELPSYRALCIPFTFNFFASNPLGFTITNPNKNYRLSDIFNRGVINSSPDFTINPTKITSNQYNQLLNNDTLMLGIFGYNLTQYNALSVNNKDLFDDFFNLGIGGVTNIFGIGVQGSLHYSGVASSFTPLQ